MKTDKVIYRTKIREEYDWLMQELEKEGCNWLCGNKPTERDMFGPFASETYIFVVNKELTCGTREDYRFFHEGDKYIEVSDIMPKGTTRKIKTDNVIYHTKTQQEYDWLMEKLEAEGFRWFNDRLPTAPEESSNWERFLSDTCIAVERSSAINQITFGDSDFYETEPEYKDYKYIEVSDLMQPYKDTKGKPKLSLVPPQIIFDIAEVREYGNKKYPSGGKDNCKRVDINDYKDALLRHTLKYLQDPKGKDSESGIEHYKHMACNIAFICEMENEKEEQL